MGRSTGDEAIDTTAHGDCLLCGKAACLTISIDDGKTIDLCVRHWNMWNHRLVDDPRDELNSSQLQVLMNDGNT